MDENKGVRIGIVIPIYNVAKYLRECLDSVANQTYGNFCAVLVNDGSTDFLEGESTSQSLQIALEYVAKDSRFVLIDKKNGGLSSARNAGISWFSGYNSFWGMQFRTCENFGESTDSSLVLSPKFSQIQKPHRHYFDCDSLHESATNQAQNCNSPSLRGVENAEAIQNKNQSARSATLKASSGAGVGVVREGEGSDFAIRKNPCIQAPTPSLKENAHSQKGEFNADLSAELCKEMDLKLALNSRDLDSSLRATRYAQNDESFVDCHENSLRSFSRNDESSHLTLYTNKNATNLNPPKIDYIIFLDSDDFWESDLLEKCVDSVRITRESNANHDIIWFDWKEIYEVSGKIQGKTTMELFGFATQMQISATQWLQRAKEREILQFWWAWKGLIRFDYLRRVNLRFLEGVIFEDNLFGVLLFSQCESIAIVPHKLYNYRIRGGSTTNNTKSLPPFVAPLKAHFSAEGDAWDYFCAYSLCEMSLVFADFCANLSEKNRAKRCESTFLPNFLAESCDILAFGRDPLNTKSRFIALLRERGKYSPYLKIIAHIIPKRLKRLRFALFLFYFAPKVAFFRTTRKILKALRICRG